MPQVAILLPIPTQMICLTVARVNDPQKEREREGAGRVGAQQTQQQHQHPHEACGIDQHGIILSAI